MRISHYLVPSGGWEFLVGGVRITEQTFDDLVKSIVAHQKINDLPISSIEEIEDQIAESHPELIINGVKLKKKPMGVSYFHTVQSFVQSLLNWALNGGQLVDQNVANIRASICVACHNNKPSNEVNGRACCGGNKVANLAVTVARATVIKDKKTTSDARLLTCGLCGCDLKIKVWFPLKALGQTKEEANAWPSFCWRKKILEGTEI